MSMDRGLMKNLTLAVLAGISIASPIVWAQDELSAPTTSSTPPAQIVGSPPTDNSPPSAPVVSSASTSNTPPSAPIVSPAPTGNSPPLEPVVRSTPSTSVTSTPIVSPAPTGNSPPPPPSFNSVPATTSVSVSNPAAPDVAQFQTWLKNINQNAQQSVSTQSQVMDAQNQNDFMMPPNPPTSSNGSPAPKKIIRHRISHKNDPDAPLVDSPPLSYKQSQEIMLKAAPPSPPPSADSDAAFSAMTQQNMPLTPEQVVKLRQLIDNSQRAAAIPATVPPKPVSSTIMINLAPGATPPAIRLAQGYVSSLVFVDSTGSPWPLASYDIGDPKTMTIQWDGKSNVLLMQAVTPYSDGNLVVRLVGLPTPVTLEVVSGQRVVDYRTDIHVPGIGPDAKDIPIGTGLPNSANQLLLNVLDGVAPPGSKQLVVSGGDCQAWLLGERMYLRTRLTLLSPGWVGRMTSPDGMYAYEIPKTSSVLVSQYGNPIELKLEGF